MQSLNISPSSRIFAGLVLGLLLIWLALTSLLSQPSLQTTFKVEQGRLIVEASSQLPLGLVVNKLESGTEEIDYFPDFAWVEEPDQLTTVADYQAFIAFQETLFRLVSAGSLVALDEHGQAYPISVYSMDWHELSKNVWILFITALASWVISLSVWAFQPKKVTSVLFLLCGLAILLSASAAAIYSGRVLTLSPLMLSLATFVNHIGTIGFTLAFLALMSHYPVALISGRWLWGLLVLFPVWLVFDQLIWLPDSQDLYLPIMLLFLVSIGFAIRQWQQTKRKPAERAALRWFLLSFYLGTGLFILLNIMPLVVGVTPVAEQSQLFLVFLFIFIGIALGLKRYRLFELDRWWFKTWVWLFGALLILLIDLVLIYFTRMASEMSLLVAVFIVGWLYFPLRTWLAERFNQNTVQLTGLLTELAESIFKSSSAEEIEQHWQTLLRHHWQPLSFCQRPTTALALENQGQGLFVPNLSGDHGYYLEMANQGRRLFNSQDVKIVKELLAISKKALIAQQQKTQAIQEERQRLMRDLHDDLAGQLMKLMVETEDVAVQQSIQSILANLRLILADLHQNSMDLASLATEWQLLLKTNLAAKSIELKTNCHIDSAQTFNPRQVSNLRRLLTEACNNIIKHSHATQVEFNCTIQRGVLLLEMNDNGVADAQTQFNGGYGLNTMRQRLEQLGGDYQVSSQPQGGCSVKFTIPLVNKLQQRLVFIDSL
jgi:signal transduction histidine kinase